ncbi:MAG: flagellar basal body rod protein FlgB [Lachnospiraceae bacterium]|nr:flagellar basal body rod protein FlgB [Lachnospiraceae bacterium]
MLRSNAFDYVNVLDKAMDVSWKRETVIANNIANATTPTYKRKDIDFASALEEEIMRIKYNSIDDAVRHMDLDDVDPEVYTDHAHYSYRIDKNNVDPDTENVELASEQLRYQTLTTAMNMEFARFKTVIK